MIVVDTQAVLWLTHDATRLSRPAHQALVQGRQGGALAIADITLRELAVVVSKGRVTVSTPLSAYLAFVESLFQVIAVSATIAERSLHFGKTYPKDPADRLIGATAIVHKARLVTADKQIRNSGEVDCVW